MSISKKIIKSGSYFTSTNNCGVAIYAQRVENGYEISIKEVYVNGQAQNYSTKATVFYN